MGDTPGARTRVQAEKGWWHAYGDAIPEGFETYVGLEADATTPRTYESDYVPGLLQTEDYAHAATPATMLTARGMRRSKGTWRCGWSGRNGDRTRCTGNMGGCQAGRGRVVGGGPVMRAQLSRLVEASNQPNVTLQVLPFSVGAHAGMDGAFMILGFPAPTDPDVTYVHYYTGTLYLEKPEDLARYTLMFDHLRAAALPVGQSRDLIVRARECGQ